MEFTELIKLLKDRPGMILGKKEFFTLHDYGIFIEGYVTASDGDFEHFFRRRFPVFVCNKFGFELTDYEFWFETISKNNTDEQEAQAMFFEYFDRFREIYGLVPKDKFDTSSVERLTTLPDEEFDVLAPKLLMWIQDINWPVAPQMVKVLSSHQDVTEKYLPEILRPDQGDAEWKVNVIRFLLPEFSSALKEEFTEWQIERIATKPTASERSEEADEAANEYLERRK